MTIPGAAIRGELWVGRDEETTVVLAAVRSVAAGHGRAVLVEGEPGVGKSALVTIGSVAAATAGCRVFRTSADELTARFPLQVLADVLGVRGLLNVGGPPAPAPWAFGDPVFSLAERVLSRVDELCAAAPVMLVVDDLHLADEATLVVWSRLASAVEQLALFLVATCRPAPHRPELSQLRRAIAAHHGPVLDLGPLSESESVELAGRLAGAPAGATLRQVIGAAGGNPLYLREMVDALARDGGIAVVDGLAEVSDTATPTTASLAGAIADRLSLLTAPTREALRLASLLGPDFVVSDLSALTGQAPSALVPVATELLTAGVLTAADQRLRFRHGLIRDSLYESIPHAMRAALHRQAAEGLAAAGVPPERVVAQLVLGPRDADVWTTGWLAEHGAALAARVPAAVEELLDRVLEQALPDESRRDELELSLAAAAFWRGSAGVLERVGRRMLSRRVDPVRAAAVSWMLGYALGRAGRYDEALPVVEEALRVIDDPSARVPATVAWQARLGAARAVILFSAGRYDEAGEQATQALRTGRECDDRAAIGYALHVLALVTQAAFDAAGAIGLIDEALTVVGDDAELCELRAVLLCNRMSWSDQPDEVAASLRAARALAGRMTAPREYGVAVVTARLHYESGRWDDAIAELEAVAGLPELYNYVPIRYGLLAVIAVRRDRQDEAKAHLAVAAEHAGTGRGRQVLTYPLFAEAAAAERAGDLPGALELLKPALVPDTVESVYSRYTSVADLVRLALAVGDRELAERAAAIAARDAEISTWRPRQAAALRCAGLLTGDVRSLDSCADFYRGCGWLPSLANVLEDAAVACAAAEDAAGARQRVGEAARIYTELRAEWELARAEARLRALGVRRHQRSRPQRPATGWQALTKTELRVAELVAEGRSNPDIAAVLFLSRRTVQTHVTHILAKLGVRSRIEVVRQANRVPTGTPRSSRRGEAPRRA